MLHKILSSKDISIEIEGKKVAMVDSFTSTSKRDSYAIYEIGNDNPTASGFCGVEYQISLNKLSFISTQNQSEIYQLKDFNLTINMPHKQIIFIGCNWLKVQEFISVNNPCVQKLELIAINRLENAI